MAMNEASLIIVEGDPLLDATIMASLAISPSSARANHMHKLPGPKVRAVVTKAMSKAMVVVMVIVVGRLVVEPMPWMPMSSTGI